jgi:flagellar protein FliO/FliZ
VIAIIYGCAWLIRRMTGMTGMNNNAIKVVSVMALGARERIAVVDVAGQQSLMNKPQASNAATDRSGRPTDDRKS